MGSCIVEKIMTQVWQASTSCSLFGFQLQNCDYDKAVTNLEGPKIFLAAPKMVSFPQLPAVKKDTIFGVARKFFGPSYFVTA